MCFALRVKGSRMPVNDWADEAVLFLNWRDIQHPQAGGAETYCWELAKRLAAAGARVTMFTARHHGATRREMRSEVEVLREGGRLSVYPAAAAHLLRHRDRYSVIVDFQNGIPFFAPLFARRATAVICVVHHVHQAQFGLHFPRPLASVGRFLEKDVARAVYGGRPVVAVSPSTRRDVRLVLGMRGPIFIVPNGVTPVAPVQVTRTEHPTIAVVTRLVPQKRLQLLILAVARLSDTWPDLQLDIAGSGPEAAALARTIRELELTDRVRLHGWVDETLKARLLRQAWMTVVPSVAEGWGLTVVEANSAGTPAVAFDVPGLRDSILPGGTGWLLPEGGDLASGLDRALTELANPATRFAFAERCERWAAAFGWDRSASRLAEIMLSELDHVRSRRRHARAICDLSVLLEGHLVDGSWENVIGTLRRTDTVAPHGRGVRLLLDGCDEDQAVQVAERLGVVPVRMRLVTSNEMVVR
jgi:glycosyltransferase involved in cell wall biosynthesis